MIQHLMKRARAYAIEAYLDLQLQREAGGLFDRVSSSLQRRNAIFYFDAADPYGYLLAQKLPALQTRYGLECTMIVVSPPRAEMRPGGDAHARYALRDAGRMARFYNVAFPADAVLPSPALVAQAQAILMRPRSPSALIAALRTVGNALWRGDAETLRVLEIELGAVPASQVASRLRANDTLLSARGHYQGSMLHYHGAWYWGIDRLVHLEQRLRREDRDSLPGDPDLVRMVAADERPSMDEREDTLVCYMSVRSPYSYIGLERAVRITDELGVTLDVRPVMPMRMRGMSVPRVKELYLGRDAAREAARHCVPFGRFCDPLGEGVERCMAVFEFAQRHGQGTAFLRSAGRGIWSEGLDMSSDGDLKLVVQRTGMDWEGARTALGDDGWRARAQRHYDELHGLDLWGVPSFRLGERTMWGQDRLPIIEDLLRRQPAAPTGYAR
ncbi:DSBA oxidoreductase [Haliangium ochraceum DSM 14365]|uniref:DSBA oxidoreductase n=2 Tax=Haliangium ochraceum TaxID=80816 RepID=D0LZP2_HALO1|nr:DSBA oxidoreductase [Haliangium ochraceum DSM 14365]